MATRWAGIRGCIEHCDGAREMTVQEKAIKGAGGEAWAGFSFPHEHSTERVLVEDFLASMGSTPQPRFLFDMEVRLGARKA